MQVTYKCASFRLKAQHQRERLEYDVLNGAAEADVEAGHCKKAMPTPDHVESDPGPAVIKKPATPRRSPAVRRTHNATPARKASAPKAGTPQSAPARTKSAAKKAEPNLLNDFLLGRPSVHRPRRKSLNVVQTEVKKSAVSKLKSPGGVKDRVKQWQEANRAAVAADNGDATSEPEETFEDVDQESVTEEDRRRIKFRKAQAKKPGRRKSGDKVGPVQLEKGRRSPKKRVVSDDHWMTKKEAKPAQQGTGVVDERVPGGVKLPKDFLKRTNLNPPLEKKIEDWAKRTSGGLEAQASPCSSPKISKAASLGHNNSPEISGMISADSGAQIARSSDQRPNGGATLETGESDKKRRSDEHRKGSRHVSRQNTTSHRKPSPRIERAPSANLPSTSDRDDNESSSILTPTRPSRKKTRQRRSHSSESLTGIPVGYSAFSVLDIPVGADASAMKVTKPARQPSLSVPKVLKRVYAEGIKIVHDTVDPPRIGVNNPPSIESWLNGTTDPFIDHDPVAKEPINSASTKSRRKSSDVKPHPQGLGGKQEENQNRRVCSLKQDEKIVDGVLEHIDKAFTTSRTSTKRDGDGDGDAKPKITLPGTGLKRSPATRNAPVSKSPRKATSESRLEALSVEKYNPSSPMKVTEPTPAIPGILDKSESSRSQEAAPRRKPSGPKIELDEQPKRPHLAPSPQSTNAALLDTPKPSNLHPSGQLNASISGKHRLSTIASIETFESLTSISETSSDISQTTASQTTVTQKTLSTINTANTSCSSRTESSTSRVVDKQSGLKRRLTKHSDLLSVLSLPDASLPGRTKSIKSARSIRTARSNLDSATISDLLRELADDEVKYMRELKTLVDGVIPVLLTCVLSRSNSAIEAGLLSLTSNRDHDSSVTKPIVDMGIALERLKSLHKHVPLHEPDVFALWASRAYKLYDEYLSSWRMGFQDIIVNLAPASNERTAGYQGLSDEMPRNGDGDVLNENGERVDVAFLLRRPLVRIKYLAKVLKGISTLKPSEQAAKADNQFQDLIMKTRRRVREEKARLEDQAASNTDTSRARDPRTLEPIEGATIDQSRQVKAKDFFDFQLLHSNKQRIDCRVELLLRDKPHDISDSGDLLICEVDSVSRWLLFPPFELDRVSARPGDVRGQLVVMVRGVHHSQEWYELLNLTCLDEETAVEWIQMLGSEPKPPKSSQAKILPISKPLLLLPPLSTENNSKPPFLSGKLALDNDVPIGERRRKRDSTFSNRQEQDLNKGNSQSIVNDSDVPVGPKSPVSESSGKGTNDATNGAEYPHIVAPKGTKALKTRTSREYASSDKSPREQGKPEKSEIHTSSAQDILPPEYLRIPDITRSRRHPVAIPSNYDSSSPRNRKGSLNGSNKDGLETIVQGQARDIDVKEIDYQSNPTSNEQGTGVEDKPPPPPLHRSSSPTTLHKPQVFSTAPTTVKSRRFSSPLKHEYQPSNASGTSSASDESDSADMQDSSDCSDCSDCSESSDEELEAVDSSSPTPPHSEVGRRPSTQGSIFGVPDASLAPSNSASQVQYRGVPLEKDVKTARLVAAISCWSPKGRWVDLHPDDCSIVISPGLIEAFDLDVSHSSTGAANGTAVPSVLSDMSSDSEGRAKRPIVGLELTPIVPLRQSNALDIEIRSPPTARSTAKCTHTVRFRSRTLQECSSLYAAIHTARMENPVYKKLEQERIVNSYGGGSYQDATGSNHRRGWFGRSKSYRASTRAPSVSISDNSIMSFSSAISRLRNMGGVGGFNIAKSSVAISHNIPLSTSSGATSVYTGSTRSATSGITPPRTPTTPSVAMTGTSNVVSLGSSNLRIRLYLLETSSRWNELGNAFLTITHPPRGMRQASSLYHGVEKRIIVTKRQSTKRGLGKGVSGSGSPQTEELGTPEVLLDVVLGGGCFSRIGVVGIAMNVWEDVVGDNGEIGTVGAVGGLSGKTRKWMFQCANAAEATWIFALVGGVGR